MIKWLRNIFKFNNKYLEAMFIALIVITLSFFIMTITFLFSSATRNMPMFFSYFSSSLLMLMNFIPIFLLMLIVYLLSNRLWVSFIVSSFLFITMSLVNKFKLTYRDDPFSFIDIKLIKESMEMAGQYEISLSRNMIILYIGLIFITIILKTIFDYKINSKKLRLFLIILVSILSLLIFNKSYFNYDTYNKVGDKSLINIWSHSQQYQSKGFIYPFIYSIKDAKDIELEGYDENKAIEDLNKYEYSNIPEEKKVNVIAVMLEAYNDFSKFDTIELEIDPYKNFHQIQNESIHGKIITDVFAGDTIKTERSFITGYKNHPKYFVNTNSFVWYLKEQGYRTEAMHPIYGWFYNRRNSNDLLGFDTFDYYENKYQAIQEVFYDDIDFFDYIIEGYENSKDNNQPYFNFTVTYQNHGPYSNEKYSENQYLKKKDSYDDATYNIINNYLAGISKTDAAIKKLVDYFSNEDEPTVLVFFGDHNPWLGKDAIGYDMLGINKDLSTVDGFLNYYETPYLIWGNNAAKQAVNSDLIGAGNDISPNFLMVELFDSLNWEGNEYLKYIRDLKSYIDVDHRIFFKENGNYTTKLSTDNERRYNDFRNVEYYYSNNFNDNK